MHRLACVLVVSIALLGCSIQGATAADDFQFIAAWGSNGTWPEQFISPDDIAVDDEGYVYIADPGNHRIKVFWAGTLVRSWETLAHELMNEFGDPRGIAIDGTGHVYVIERMNDRVLKFASDGTFIKQWGSYGHETGEFDWPGGIAVDSAGNVYVVDSFNHRIQKFTPEGTHLATLGGDGPDWGGSGTGPGEFSSPEGVAVDGAGSVYVADTWNHRVQKFTPDGALVATWGRNGGDGSAGTGPGEFDSPGGIEVDRAGNVYVVDTDNDRIQTFTSTGALITMWGTLGTGDGQFNHPRGVAVDEAGHAFVVDTDNSRFQRFARQDELTGDDVLAEAVDANDLVFMTGGAVPWYRNLSEGYGGDCARAGTINKFESSWVETTVQGPGFLDFDWMVRCIENSKINLDSNTEGAEASYLVVSANDVPMGVISGVSGLKHKSLFLPDNTSYQVRWRFYRAWNQWHAVTDEGAWLDRVRFRPTIPLDDPALGGNLTFTTKEEPRGNIIHVIFGQFISEIEFFGTGGWYGYYPDGSGETGTPVLTHSPITDDRQIWLNATVHGPGTVRFDWMVDSEADHDHLAFWVDDQPIYGISGQKTAWTPVEKSLTQDREYTIAWRYGKDGSGSAGTDRGSLRNVDYLPSSSAPTASFTANVTSGPAPLAVQFTDTSPGSPASWAWTFGDGETSTLQHPVHVYASPGTYTVALTVRNGAGQSDTETRTGMITVSPPPITVASIAPASGTRGTTVAITNLTGTGLVSPATVTLTRTGSADIAATNIAVVSPTKITCQLALPATAATGLWNVVVTSGGSTAILANGFTVGASVVAVPGSASLPMDTNADGKFDDVNGNGRQDFADVVLYFNQMTWIADHEPLGLFDYNANGRIDFADVVWLFNNL